MRRVFVVLMCLASMSGSSRGSDPQNLLANPDFEQEEADHGTPESWYPYSPEEAIAQATRVELITDARAAHGGSRCARVTTPGIRVHNGRDVPVEPDKEYSLSCHVRGKGTVSLGWYELKDSAFLKTIEEAKPRELTQDWQRIEWRSTPQLRDTTRVRVFLRCEGDVYVDTARFCAASELANDGPDKVTKAEHPLLSPAYVARAPVVDGLMSKGEWEGAASLTGFLRPDGKLSSQQVRLWAAFDEKNLYFCFQSFSPRSLMGTAKTSDDPGLFHDDVVKVFLRPGGTGPYYQFAVNPLGTRFEAEGTDSAWNATWHAASVVKKDVWLVS
jgi:hypothetical protein